MHTNRERPRVPSSRGVVWSAVGSAYAVSLIHLAIALIIVTGDPGSTGLLAAATVSGESALCLFAAAGVTGYVRNSLLAAAWGYVPGLAWVLAGGLWLSEAQTGSDGSASLGLVALVLADPLVWVSIGLAGGVGITASRAGHLAWAPWARASASGWRRAVPVHVGGRRDVRAPSGARTDTVGTDPQEALERLVPLGSELTSASG